MANTAIVLSRGHQLWDLSALHTLTHLVLKTKSSTHLPKVIQPGGTPHSQPFQILSSQPWPWGAITSGSNPFSFPTRLLPCSRGDLGSSQGYSRLHLGRGFGTETASGRPWEPFLRVLVKTPEVVTSVPPETGSGGLREHHNGSSGVEGHSPGSMFTPFLMSLLQGRLPWAPTTVRPASTLRREARPSCSWPCCLLTALSGDTVSRLSFIHSTNMY